MMLSSSNRSTPTTGDGITRIVRQNFIPKRVKACSDEKITCRTDTKCQKDKPDDYWSTNYHRRQENLTKGFFSSQIEAYEIVGGKLVLDPYELVTTSLSDNIDQKRCQKYSRRGPVYQESEKKEIKPVKKAKKQTETSTKQDLIDAAPSAGFDDIRKLINESQRRITFVRAGKPYTQHVSDIEEQRNKELLKSIKTEENDMVIKSASSMLLHVDKPSDKSSDSKPSSAKSESRAKKPVKISDLLRATTPPGNKLSARRQTLLAPFAKDKMSFMNVGTVLHRKERQFRDHLQFLKSIYSVLNAIHNMKLRDIRSKVPLSIDVVERLQKDDFVYTREQDGQSSRGTNIRQIRPQSISNESRMEFPTKQRLPTIQAGNLDNQFSSSFPGKRVQRQSILGHANESRMEFPTKQRLPSIQSVNLENSQFRSQGGGKTDTSTHTVDTDQGDSTRRMNSMYGTFRRMGMLDGMSKQVGMRKSKFQGNIMTSDRPAPETWEDLLNVQPEPYKDQPEKSSLPFQVGVLSKFMKWFRESKQSESETKEQSAREKKINRLASITSQQAGATQLSKLQLSKLQENYDKREKLEFKNQEDEKENPTQVEKVRKIPIWQQVAQEKSTTVPVFNKKSKRSPSRDETVERARRNFNNLKSSVQKENNVQLEKMVRERLADFRLKFSALSNEDGAKVLFRQQMQKLAEAVGINKAHFEHFEVQPSKWYEDLKAMTDAKVSSSFLPKTSEVMTKLQTYAHMDHKTVSYAKAKLCLLTMSLPAYEICHIHMQKAIQFVLENILLGQESQFIEWLDHRKMPYVIVEVQEDT